MPAALVAVFQLSDCWVSYWFRQHKNSIRFVGALFVMTVSRKNPPFTRLETLSKSKIWLITCWPFFLALMVLLLDTNSDMHTTSIAFSQSHCALPLQCYTRTISSEEKKEKGILNDGIAITFTLPMQALLLHFC